MHVGMCCDIIAGSFCCFYALDVSFLILKMGISFAFEAGSSLAAVLDARSGG